MNKKCMYCLHSIDFERCNLHWECEYEPNFIADKFIEELEAIKAEIRKKQEINCNMNCNKCEWNHPAVDIKKVEIVKKDIEIIDNHISEWKGENK